jgi:hypothetical protein
MNEYIAELNEAVKERNKELLENCGKVATVFAVGVVISGLCILASKKLKYLLLV